MSAQQKKKESRLSSIYKGYVWLQSPELHVPTRMLSELQQQLKRRGSLPINRSDTENPKVKDDTEWQERCKDREMWRGRPKGGPPLGEHGERLQDEYLQALTNVLKRGTFRLDNMGQPYMRTHRIKKQRGERKEQEEECEDTEDRESEKEKRGWRVLVWSPSSIDESVNTRVQGLVEALPRNVLRMAAFAEHPSNGTAVIRWHHLIWQLAYLLVARALDARCGDDSYGGALNESQGAFEIPSWVYLPEGRIAHYWIEGDSQAADDQSRACFEGPWRSMRGCCYPKGRSKRFPWDVPPEELGGIVTLPPSLPTYMRSTYHYPPSGVRKAQTSAAHPGRLSLRNSSAPSSSGSPGLHDGSFPPRPFYKSKDSHSMRPSVHNMMTRSRARREL